VTAGPLLKVEKDRVSGSLVDAFFFGEGEGWMQDIVRLAAQGLRQRRPKTAILAEIASSVEGFWPCDSQFTAQRALSRQRPPILAAPLALNGENAGHTKLAITAGCSGHCSFCLEGWDRRPFREKSLEELAEAAPVLKRATGASDVELFSYNFNMHHEILALIPAMGRYFFHVSLMSRPRLSCKNQRAPRAEFAAGKRSLRSASRYRNAARYYRKGISGRRYGARLIDTEGRTRS